MQSGTFTLVSSAGASVAGALSYNSTTNTDTFTPSAALAYGTTYTATVSGAKNTCRRSDGGSPVIWSFTTDPLQPAVTSSPAGLGVYGRGRVRIPSATFNEAVQSASPFTLATSAGTSVAGTLSYNSTTNTETFTPSAALAYGTTYTATVSGAKDADGDPMSGSTTWSFTTDPLQPAVTSHVPASSATGVAVSATASATFNEAVQSVTFTLTSGAGASVAGALSYNSTTNTETFTPSAALAYGTTYTATVSGAKDADGDPMSGSTSWSFTTDPLQPAVTSHIPASSATGVAVSATASATFNEAVQSRHVHAHQRARGHPSPGLSLTTARPTPRRSRRARRWRTGRPTRRPSAAPRTRTAIR